MTARTQPVALSRKNLPANSFEDAVADLKAFARESLAGGRQAYAFA